MIVRKRFDLCICEEYPPPGNMQSQAWFSLLNAYAECILMVSSITCVMFVREQLQMQHEPTLLL